MTDPVAAPLLALGVGVLLGLRHATDPDHLTAVVLLVAGEGDPGRRRAGALGLAWGLGHAVTCTALGLAVIAASPWLPEWLLRAAEVGVGVLVAVLAVRLLLRWRRGRLHAHPHHHGALHHSHPHAHEREHGSAAAPAHRHAHAERLGRSPWEAFAVGLVHGVGGSAAAGALLVAPIAQRGGALAVLLCFSLATAAAMALASAALGAALGGPAARRIEAWVPALGAGGLVFGVWYAVQAWFGSGGAA